MFTEYQITGNFLTDNRGKQAVLVSIFSLVRQYALFSAFYANLCKSAGYGQKSCSGDAIFIPRFAIDALSSLNKCLVASRFAFCQGATQRLSCRDKASVISRKVFGHGEIGDATCVHSSESVVSPPVSLLSENLDFSEYPRQFISFPGRSK